MLLRPPDEVMLLDRFQLRGVRMASKNSDRVRPEFLGAQACLRLHDCTRDGLLELPFGDQTRGARHTLLAAVHREEPRSKRAEKTDELDAKMAR